MLKSAILWFREYLDSRLKKVTMLEKVFQEGACQGIWLVQKVGKVQLQYKLVIINLVWRSEQYSLCQCQISSLKIEVKLIILKLIFNF